MKEMQHSDTQKYIIIEEEDIFNEQTKFEEIPDYAKEPELYEQWLRAEKAATLKLLNRLIRQNMKMGYTKYSMRDAEYCTKAKLDIGKKGVYLLLLVSPNKTQESNKQIEENFKTFNFKTFNFKRAAPK